MIKYLFICFSLLCGVADASAQSKDELTVNALIDQLSQAIVKADKETLMELVSEQLSYGHSSGKVENKAQFIETVLTGPIRFSSIELSDRTISFSGVNAVARNTFFGKATVNGEARDIKIQTLMVWQKSKGRWKLLARQGFKV